MAQKKIKGTVCSNCDISFRVDDLYNNYCPNCGQENHNPRLPLFYYIYELVENIIHFDNKTWVTLRTLFLKPGVATRDHIENKRARYTPPFRLFIFSLAVFIISLEAAQDTMVKREVSEMKNLSLSEQMLRLADTARIGFSDPFFNGKKIYYDVRQLRELQAMDYSGIRSWLQSAGRPSGFLHRFQARMVKHNIASTQSVEAYNRHIVRIHYSVILIMLPVSAFLIYFVFYRRNLLYYDTLVLSVHLYVFSLLIGIIMSILTLFLISFGLLRDTTIVLPLIMTASLVLNFIPAYKKVFMLSWKATTGRALIVAALNMVAQVTVFWLVAGYLG